MMLSINWKRNIHVVLLINTFFIVFYTVSLIRSINKGETIRKVLVMVAAGLQEPTWFIYCLCFLFQATGTHVTSEDSARFKSGRKLILFWNSFFDATDFYVGFGSEPFTSCSAQVSHLCQTTANRSLFHQSDAVIFHFPTLDILDMPEYRLPHQRWVVKRVSLESIN